MDSQTEIIIKSVKFKLYPDEKQKNLIEKTFGATRFIYNYFLRRRQDAYKENKETLNFFKCSLELTQLKKQKEYLWLNEISRVALDRSLRNLDTAYKNFFKTKKGYPKFKNKFSKQSYSETNKTSYYTDRHYVHISKLGKVRTSDLRGNIPENGRHINTTISKSKTGNYYCSMSFEVERKRLVPTKKEAGIDLGIKDLVITSDGEKFDNPHFLTKYEDRLKRLQRKLSKKQKDSSNYEKLRIKIAKLHEYISNCRSLYLHRISKKLIEDYDFIGMEDLNVKGMTRNHHLAKALTDVSLGELKRQLEYKANYYGKIVESIDRFYPSSQLCSNCGYQNKEVKNLNIRDWICPKCGQHHDRDINAAKNILFEAKRQFNTRAEKTA